MNEKSERGRGDADSRRERERERERRERKIDMMDWEMLGRVGRGEKGRTSK